MHIAILCISAVAICTERVEAKIFANVTPVWALLLQSARSVWRQSCHARLACHQRLCCNLHGACGGKAYYNAQQTAMPDRCNLHGACGGKAEVSAINGIVNMLQSARSVWRQRSAMSRCSSSGAGCNLHGACGGKVAPQVALIFPEQLQSARSVWRQSFDKKDGVTCGIALQSARSVWRQRSFWD